jgi:hypothetical protein
MNAQAQEIERLTRYVRHLEEVDHEILRTADADHAFDDHLQLTHCNSSHEKADLVFGVVGAGSSRRGEPLAARALFLRAQSPSH